jgi:hypothetical protein
MVKRTNHLFDAGKLTVVMDGGAGSSGKGKMSSFITDQADNWTFACNSFAPQAGHWVRLEDGRQYFYQQLNSCAYNIDKYQKMYIGPGATIELPALLKEIADNKVPTNKLGISPLAAILEDFDSAFERGERGFDNTELTRKSEGTMKTGSTCLPYKAMVETILGPKTIGWIVNTRYDGHVKSLDEKGEFRWSKVIGHQALENSGKQWVSVHTDADKTGVLVATSDHQCAYVSDVLAPVVQFGEAGSLRGKYQVRMTKQTPNNLNTNHLFGPNQVRVMMGMLLGNGTIHKGSLTCDHGSKQTQYLEYKRAIVGGKVSYHESGWSEDVCPRLSTVSNAQTKALRKMLFSEGPKNVTGLFKYADLTSFAFWYMDDGHLVNRKKRSPNMVLRTDKFTPAEHTAAIAWFKEVLNTDDVTVSHRNRLRLGSAATSRLSKLIAKYVPESMRYKLPKEDRALPFEGVRKDTLEYGANLITKVLPKRLGSKLYDIEVADTHTFIANRAVVHNCHGVGSVAARRVLRSASLRLARDIPELQAYLCDVPGEISARLDHGEAGLMELAQGFQLSLLHGRFAPHTTSRQVTVAQGLSDLFLPTKYAGQVVVNLRTFPIRISSNKYIGVDGKHLTAAEVESGVAHSVYTGSSGDWYPDQIETTWEKVTANAGSPTPIREITSVTKLTRRVATFSKMNALEALKYNDTGHRMHLSINFANYVDNAVAGATDVDGLMTSRVKNWLDENVGELQSQVCLVGTGAKTHETVILP